ncbi:MULTISPECIES: hypothetical protein [unclassified Streptomyces]|uniref:hypothetical protein n=1 Tax=unclassified Streptomyces TaxID=2593676 RepID=UPI000C07B9A0|nr:MULTISPECIES: hypothetical protein [unclassified Streptomyces]MYQ37795.1 hypothetical protein [Streptomyces sp. SID4921]
MEFDASFPSDSETFELVEQGEGLRDDVAVLAQALDVRGALEGDDRQGPAAPQFPSTRLTVWVMSLTFAAVVMTFERGAVSVADQVVFAARLPPLDRRRAGIGAPFFARMWEPSTHARDQLSSPAAFSSASRTWCSRSKTPAVCPRSRRRQHV